MCPAALLCAALAVCTNAARPFERLNALGPHLGHSSTLVNVTRPDNASLEDTVCKQCQGAFVDYNELLKTTQRPVLVQICFVLMLFFLAWFMGDTAGNFFGPSLLFWTRRLKLSTSMAACLLAIGNGAPDMAGAVAAVELEDVPLQLSVLAGSSLCSICLANGAGLLASCCLPQEDVGELGLASGEMIEMVAFYILAMLVLILLLRGAVVKATEAWLLPAVYLLYLARLTIFRSKEDLEKLGPKRRDSNVEVALEDSLACVAVPTECSPVDLCWWLVTLPLNLLRLVTIPPCDKRWDQPRRALHAACPLGLLVFCLLTGSLPEEMSLLALSCLALLAGSISVWLWVMGGTGSALPPYYGAMTLVTLVACILWLKTLSFEFLALLETFAHHIGVPRLRMGFTTMAWANCVGDIATTVALVRAGQASMAFVGTVSSQFLNLTIGCSLAFFVLLIQANGTAQLFPGGWPGSISSPLLVAAMGIFLALSILLGLGRYADGRWFPVLLILYVSFIGILYILTPDEVPWQLDAH
eukprot:TRINITY_DN76889_c0_g1_i1.p1 TRINITY_DN76889_c0_g1~~TRINITY_DN76889_c0_g1_i1.p1  ORF type:complete len:528 (+),score=72.55 TRINITY_DN76889_c0_g1_i1:70-1653(+)